MRHYKQLLNYLSQTFFSHLFMMDVLFHPSYIYLQMTYLKLFLHVIQFLHSLMQLLKHNLFFGFIVAFFFFVRFGESIYGTLRLKFVLWHL